MKSKEALNELLKEQQKLITNLDSEMLSEIGAKTYKEILELYNIVLKDLNTLESLKHNLFKSTDPFQIYPEYVITSNVFQEEDWEVCKEWFETPLKDL